MGPSNQSQTLHSKVSVPHHYLNPTKAYYRSIQPKPNASLDGLSACPTVLPRAVTSTSPRPNPSFAFSGAQTAPALQTKSPPVGPESCWGSAVLDALPTPGRLKAKASSPTHPLPLYSRFKGAEISFAFSGFEGAQTAPALQTKYPPVGPEFWWGSAASDACRRLRIRSKAKASSPTHPLPLAGSKVPKSPLLLAGSKVPKRHRLCRPNGHPFGPESCC